MLQTGQKPKILIIVTLGVWGGAQKYVFDLASGLGKRFEITVASGSTDGELVRQCLRAGIAYRTIPSLTRPVRPIDDLRAIREIAQLVRQEGFRIVHSNSSKAGVVGAIGGRLGGAKTVFTVHGLVLNEPLSPLTRALYWAGEKLGSWFRDFTIVVSEADQAAVLSAGLARPGGVSVIHNGGDTARRYPTPAEARQRLAETTGVTLAPAAPVVGTIADFFDTKDYPTFVEAARRVLADRPDAHFFAFGRGDDSPVRQLIQRAGLEKQIHLVIGRSDAAEFLPAFDIFTLASIKEGLPYTVIEAAACGRAIVATRVGGVPDIIEHEVSGLLVQPRDPGAISTSVLELLSNPDKAGRFGKSAMGSIGKFSISRMLDETAGVYQRLLN